MKFKILLIWLIVVSATSNLFAQNDFDSQMRTMKALECPDISNNSSILFVKYIKLNQLDSAKGILSYWKGKCGEREPIQRAEIILKISSNEKIDSAFNSDILNHIFNFKNRVKEIKSQNFENFDYYQAYFGFVPFNQTFDKFSFDYFSKIKQEEQNKQSAKNCIAEFYSGNTDSIFKAIQKGVFRKTNLDSSYNKLVLSRLNMIESSYFFHTGIWIPMGKLSTLGIHPILGFGFGGKKKKVSFDLVFDFRILQAANYYSAKKTRSDTFQLTNHYLGIYSGLETAYDIFSLKKNLTQIVGGFGYDGFDIFQSDNYGKNNSQNKSYTVGSYNFNFGIAQRYYLKRNNSYIQASLKYNFTDYTLNHLINLTGNVITFKLSYGFGNNFYKVNALNALDYSLR